MPWFHSHVNSLYSQTVVGKCNTWTLDMTGLVDWTCGLDSWTDLWTGFWTDVLADDDYLYMPGT